MMSIPFLNMSVPFDNMSGPIPGSVPFLIFLVMSVNVEAILLGGGQKPLLKPRQTQVIKTHQVIMVKTGQASMQGTATDDRDGLLYTRWYSLSSGKEGLPKDNINFAGYTLRKGVRS